MIRNKYIRNELMDMSPKIYIPYLTLLRSLPVGLFYVLLQDNKAKVQDLKFNPILYIPLKTFNYLVSYNILQLVK